MTTNDDALRRLAQPGPPLRPPTTTDWKPRNPAYWGKLLACGLALLVVSGIFIGIYENSVIDTGSYDQAYLPGHDPAWLIWALLFGGIGQILLIPGLIGWGIHSSGIDR